MNIAYENMGAAASLVVAIVAEGHSQQQYWPFITILVFQERAATVMKLSGAIYIGMNPLVTLENREKWENYSTGEAAQWYQEAQHYQQQLGIDDLDGSETGIDR